MSEPKEGDLQVWWVPQVPMKCFLVAVPDLATAKLMMDTLADYDEFQFKNKVRGDYCNAGGVQTFEDGEWWDVDEEELENIGSTEPVQGESLAVHDGYPDPLSTTMGPQGEDL